MILSTRDRLITSASELFADRGYRGASVRDICNLARANPGAVSYHFGGKRQLYRTVLRQAAERLAAAGAGAGEAAGDALAVLRRVFRRLDSDPVAARLLLRDLADGGGLGVEALEPTLRGAVEALRSSLGGGETSRVSVEVRMLFLELAAPLFLLTAGWPVVERALDLDEGQREQLLESLIRRRLIPPATEPPRRLS